MIAFYWTGTKWESIEIYFTLLQRALWIELDSYAGEVWI